MGILDNEIILKYMEIFVRKLCYFFLYFFLFLGGIQTMAVFWNLWQMRPKMKPQYWNNMEYFCCGSSGIPYSAFNSSVTDTGSTISNPT